MSVTNERFIRIAIEKTSNLRFLFLQHITIAILRWTNERIWTMDHTCLLMMVVEALNLRGGPMDRRPPPGLSTQGRIQTSDLDFRHRTKEVDGGPLKILNVDGRTEGRSEGLVSNPFTITRLNSEDFSVQNLFFSVFSNLTFVPINSLKR